MDSRIDKNKIPKHIAIIMDGNGRWAKKRGISRINGHQNAVQAVRDTTEGCAELGVSYLTLYAFSTENWERPKSEVEGLMMLLVNTIKNELSTLKENNIKLSSIGDIEALPTNTYESLMVAKEATRQNDGMELILALNYSGRWDIQKAIEKAILNGEGTNFEKYLSTYGIEDPELLIRTSGEMRVSNFLLWQLAYTELYFTEVLWPDFRKKDLLEGILAFQIRERRFGKTSEQVNT